MRITIWDFCVIKILELLRPLFVHKKIRFTGVADWFVFSLFVLPSYFGVRLAFFDLTAVRFFEILILIGILKNVERRKQFICLVKNCQNNIFILAYMCIVIYTNLIHPSLNSIFYWITNFVLIIYLVAYLVIYEYGVEEFFDRIKKYTWIIVCISPLELIIGRTPFSLLDTLGKSIVASRFGSARIVGNCTVANAYAMYLMILMPICCYDCGKKRIDIGKNKFLLMLIALNIFLTGSRMSIGTLIVGFIVCIFVQPRQQLKHTLLFLLIALPVFLGVLYLGQDISFFQNIIRTFFSAVDAVLDSNYSVQFGANEQTLYNSTYYRELLFENTILGNWLNPWLGRGGGYNLAMYIEGYSIVSVDNFYVGQYIAYAWPGLIAWILMSLSFFVRMIRMIIHKEMLGYILMVSFVCYYISLWYLDQLQTYPAMAAIFGVTYGYYTVKNKRRAIK